MNNYTEIMIARTEHEQRNRSLPIVSDYEHCGHNEQLGWVGRQIGRLSNALGNGLTSVGEKLKHGRDVEVAATRATQEHESVLS